MEQQKSKVSSTRHEEVYHATLRCQAASLFLTSQRLHGLKKACQVEGQKTGCRFASQRNTRVAWRRISRSGSTFGMETLCGLKRAALILLFLVPDSKDNSHPDIGERTYSHRMAFAFRSLALIVIQCPWLLQGTLPGEGVHRIAQRFDTPQPSVNLAVVSTGEGYRGGSGQSLQARRIRVAGSIIPNFSEQTRCKAFASSGQTLEDLMV